MVLLVMMIPSRLREGILRECRRVCVYDASKKRKEQKHNITKAYTSPFSSSTWNASYMAGLLPSLSPLSLTHLPPVLMRHKRSSGCVEKGV